MEEEEEEEEEEEVNTVVLSQCIQRKGVGGVGGGQSKDNNSQFDMNFLSIKGSCDKLPSSH